MSAVFSIPTLTNGMVPSFSLGRLSVPWSGTGSLLSSAWGRLFRLTQGAYVEESPESRRQRRSRSRRSTHADAEPPGARSRWRGWVRSARGLVPRELRVLARVVRGGRCRLRELGELRRRAARPRVRGLSRGARLGGARGGGPRRPYGERPR